MTDADEDPLDDILVDDDSDGDLTGGQLACYRCAAPLDREDLSEPLHFDGGERFMCDPCNLATRILLYTRPDPPFVDVGLYQEVVFYARQLAATAVPEPPETVVDLPDGGEDDAQ